MLHAPGGSPSPPRKNSPAHGGHLDMAGIQPAIIDAHAHVWDAQVLGYPWLGAVTALPQTASAAQLLAETAASGYIFVEAGVEAGAEAAEVAWMARSAWSGLRGIVAAVDLRARGLDDSLDALAYEPLVVGVRHNLQSEPSGALAEPRLRRGLEAVAARGLAFDACVRRDQLGELASLIDSVPALDVVVDHLGNPDLAAGLASAAGRRWGDQLGRLSGSPSTHIKISGLSAGATEDTLRTSGSDFVRAAVDAFGASRCMIGSDWPVSTTLGAGASFTTWTALVRSALSPEDWPAVAGQTARSFYLADRG